MAAASYRSGQALHDEQENRSYDFTRKHDMQHSEILAPVSAPAWVRERGRLAYIHIAEIISQNDTAITICYHDKRLEIRGQYLDEVIDALEDERARIVRLFDANHYDDAPEEGTAVIWSVESQM